MVGLYIVSVLVEILVTEEQVPQCSQVAGWKRRRSIPGGYRPGESPSPGFPGFAAPPNDLSSATIKDLRNRLSEMQDQVTGIVAPTICLVLERMAVRGPRSSSVIASISTK